MKKQVLFAIATMTLASCSSDGLVNNSSSGGGEAPIAFSVEKKNITRATQNLEATGHYNFGVWAYKVKGSNSQLVMDNYLVGYSNETTKKGYEHSGCSTWAATIGDQDDHTSPWFYENLGTSEYTYTGTDGYYTKNDGNYTSANANQILRYWDLAYTNTNFYAYAPYNKNVEFKESTNGTKTMIFDAKNTIRDGYDNPLNSAYAGFDRSLSEYMYAGVQATNSAKKDVIVPFKHMGAQVNVRFYEDIPNYRVEIIDLGADNGTFATGVKDDLKKGIQATPAVKGTGDSYTKGSYFTTNGATVTFAADATPTFDYTTEGSSSTSDNLMFKLPTTNLDNTTISGHNLLPQEGDGKYSESPTVYYAVAQKDSETGFTFHISYRIIAEDNKEVITVHNATVFVPAKDGSEFIAAWQPNVKYTYSFKITKNSTGTTNPETDIKPTDPTPSTTKSLYPIVFDGATIEDYSEKYPVSEVSGENTNY